MNKRILLHSLAAILATVPAWAQPRNVVLFTADGTGITSLNAASIYGYDKPRGLYVQNMPYLALSDTSTAKEWITDGPATATAWATGTKTGNGIISEGPSAERGKTPGEQLKTILEYAEERGLSTGIVTDNDENGVGAAAVSAFYAHTHMSQSRMAGDNFMQLLNTKYGDGVDVVIGPGRKLISGQLTKKGVDLEKEIRAKGYAYATSLADLAKVDASAKRVIALTVEGNDDFDLPLAIQQAVAHLRKNPKGFILIANSDCKYPSAGKSLEKVIAYDKIIREISEQNKQDTFIMFTGSHAVNLRIKGEHTAETQRAAAGNKITSAIAHQKEHSAEEVPVLAMGPGAERVGGYVSNTQVFHYMMDGLGLGR
jgi:alkaline phosphatase